MNRDISTFTSLTWQIAAQEKIPKPQHRYVASLDLLGFRNALETYGIDKMSRAYSSALSYARAIKSARKTLFQEAISPGYSEDEGNPDSAEMFAEPRHIESTAAYPTIIHHAVFSDSLFLFSEDISADSCRDLIDLSNAIFQIFLSWRLPLCGGIAKGECIVWPERQIYLGDAIVQAFELQSKVDIVGVVCHSDVPSSERLSSAVKVPLKVKCCESQSCLELRVPLPLPAIRQGMWTSKPDLVACFQALAKSAPPQAQSKYVNGRRVVEMMTGLNIPEVSDR